jgi:hypothetical protein
MVEGIGKLADTGSPKDDSTKASGKDVWDKLGTLTTLISSVVIGAAGVLATYEYNTKELAIKHVEKEAEEQRELTKRLEALFKFVSSENQREREFGYAMFAALGQESLASKIIAASRDPAGVGVIEGIVRDEVTRYSVHLKTIGFTNLVVDLRLRVFSEQSPEATVPEEFKNSALPLIKQGWKSWFDNGVMYIRNDLVDKLYYPLREYTHFALLVQLGDQIPIEDADFNTIESSLSDYYPSSFLEKMTVDRPLGTSGLVQGRRWVEAFWECRSKLSAPKVDSMLFQAWIKSYHQETRTLGSQDKFRDALLTIGTDESATCFREVFVRRGLM